MIHVLKLATTLSCCMIVIQKLNNITINYFQNLQPSILLDKWRFNTSQDWEILRDEFNNVSLDTISNGTLQPLSFHLSPLDYFEKRALQFIDITNDPDLTIELIVNNQPIMDSEDEKVKKQNKRAPKRKTQLDNLFALVWVPVGGFAALLSFHPILILCFGSPTLLSSYFGSPTYLLLFLICPEIPTALLSCFVPAPVPGFLAALLSFSVDGPGLLYLPSTALGIFKQVLSDQFLYCCSTSPVKTLCLFLPLGLLPNKTDCNQTFNIAFINSCPLASNHTWKEVDLSFAKCICLDAIKLNRLWQLELLDFKPVCIMKAISLTATIF